MAEEAVIIDIKIDSDDAARRLETLSALYAANTRQIDENKAKQKELNKQFKEGSISQSEYGKQTVLLRASTAELTSQNRALEATGRAIISATEEQTNSFINANGSIASMRREVTSLQQQYAQLSKTERESAAGKEMLKHLQDLESETRESEMEMRNFKTTIGNYPSVFKGAFGTIDGVLKNFGTSITDLSTGGSKGFAMLGKSVLAFGKLFLVPPIIIITAILTAIMIVVKGVSNAFKKNDEVATSLQRAFASLEPIMILIRKIFDGLAFVISKVVEALAAAVMGIIKFLEEIHLIPEGAAEAAKAQQDLVTAIDDLEEAERKYVVNSAKRDSEISELKVKAKQKDKYTLQERMDFLQQAIDKEKQNLIDEKAIAEERLRILVATAEKEQDTSDETAQKIAEAEAAKYKAVQAYNEGTQRLESQLTNAIIEEQREREEAAKAAMEARKARLEALEGFQRELKDRQIANIKDELKREIALRQEAAKRQIDDLKKQLKEKENLSRANQEAIKKLILQIETDLAADVANLQAQNIKEQLNRTIAAETERQNLLLEKATQGSDEYYALRFAAINRMRLLELQNTELSEQEKLNIVEKYAQQEEALKLERDKRQFEERKLALQNDFEEQLQQAADNEVLAAQLELERATAAREELNAMYFETAEQRRAAEIAADNAILASSKRVQESQKAQIQQQFSLMNSTVDSIKNIFNTLGEDNAEFVAFQKILAIASATIKLGEAIAAATATATAGDPYTVALRIAAAVASVGAAFASVLASIKSAVIPDPPQFYAGGVVGGSALVGDTVRIRANSGEMILTAEQQAALFEMANKGLNYRNSYEDLALALSSALQDMPAPVLDYTEFTTFQNNLKKIKSYETL